MRVCVQSGLLRLYPLDLALRTIREAGYDGVELWGGQPHGYILDLARDVEGELVLDEERAETIRTLCASQGLDLVCYTPEQVLYPINVLVEETAPFDGVAMRGRSRRQLELSIDAAAALGCGRVVVAAPIWPWQKTAEGYTRVRPEAALDAAIADVERLVRHAEGRGVTILVEACPAEYCNTIVTLDDTMRVLERIPSPRLQVVLDTGHVAVTAMQLGHDPVSYFRDHVQALGPRLGHVHVDDNHGDTDAHLVPGAGTLDLGGMIGALQGTGYDGWLSVELGILGDYILPERADQLLRESRAYLDRILLAGAEGRAR